MRLLSLSILSLLGATAFADEGMWLPEQMLEVGPEWADQGLELPAEVLADPFRAPLGAIISLGGCSASFVSDSGLVVTNHHCVESYLSNISDDTTNRHKDGFSASSREEELSVGTTGRIWVVEKLTDVTSKVLAGINSRTSDTSRELRMEKAVKKLVAQCEKQPNHRCYVAPYFGGSTFRLVDTLEIQDVRLVFAPPYSVGQFGGDIDNWMWPRHSADFAFLRAYVAPDGSSAPYSEDNVPYTPKHHLKINAEGANPGDFVMVAGYPGRTNRHELIDDLEHSAMESLPLRQEMMQQIFDIDKGFAEANPEAAARLAPAMSGLANYAKNTEGLLEGLQRGGLLDKKAEDQAQFLEWIQADPKRSARLMPIYEELQAFNADAWTRETRDVHLYWMRRTSAMLSAAWTGVRWADESQKSDSKREPRYQERNRPRALARMEMMDKSIYLPAERAGFEAILVRYQALDDKDRIPELDAWLEANGGLSAALDTLYADPALAKVEARLALMEASPKALAASDDPWISLALALDAYAQPVREEAKTRSGQSQRLWSAWMSGLQEWYADRGEVLYDDANSTLRLTLGHVKGYNPQDGLIATPQTTLAGLANKVGEAPFDAPEFLKDAAMAGQNSRWFYEPLGDVPVNFLNTLDTTGGNSGSAVLDGQGQLVGLLFDGVYESIAADWVYVDAYTRSISVDIRFVLWVLDQFEGTDALLTELGYPKATASN